MLLAHVLLTVVKLFDRVQSELLRFYFDISLRKDFEEAMDGALDNLVRRTRSKNILFIGELTEDRRFYGKMVRVDSFIYSFHSWLCIVGDIITQAKFFCDSDLKSICNFKVISFIIRWYHGLIKHRIHWCCWLYPCSCCVGLKLTYRVALGLILWTQDHLTCFLPGTLVYAMHHGLTNKYQKFAEELMHTCYLTYTMNPTMLAAELTHFNSEASVTSSYFLKF